MAGMVAAVLLASCVKDDLYNTPHPDKGAVVITTDWTDALAESTVPGTYLLRMDDGKAVPTSEKTTVYPELLTPVAHKKAHPMEHGDLASGLRQGVHQVRSQV